jgi:hypothetical protein
MSRNSICAVAVLVCWGFAAVAPAQFMPGRVYVSDPPPPEIGCTLPGLADNDRIRQYDPASGIVSTFVVMPDEFCGGLWGLAFTPDGTRLRAAEGAHHNILDIDSTGNITVALNASNGLFFPGDVTYDHDGNFYVVNFNGEILRFAPDSSTPMVFAGPSPLNFSNGPIADAPNGDIYYAVRGAQAPYNAIVRFTPEGDGSVFDVPDGSLFINSLATSSAGDLFVLAHAGVTSAIYHYTGGDPDSEMTLVSSLSLFGPAGSMALSADEHHLYVAAGVLYSIDTVTGQVTTFATGIGPGTGIAVYVPEPGSLPLILGTLVLACSRGRRA